ncbi:MAG TPA: recombination factor protein RarA, partial [Burkholderiales bacterium]|nr:recombination factor protein RarA [Burkholderiales bacterium]
DAAETREAAVDAAAVQRVAQRKVLVYDKSGEEHFNLISALHKSLRESDPDAGLYWFARMLEAGEEPGYLARRLTRFAVEDVGLADPRALRVTLDACETYERLGSPEGELALAEAALYLAVAAKSNAVYEAYNAARDFVSADGTRPVPLHIRNAPTPLMKNLGHGKGYRYAHDEPDAYSAGQTYFPEGMPAVEWYRPTERGLEAKIRQRIEELRSKK